MAGFLFMISCDSSEPKNVEVKAYYDLRGFVNGEIEIMSRLKPLVTKKLQTDGKSDNRSTKEIDWKKELELFIQADINKPAYGKSYSIMRPDSLTYEYKLKAGETLPVQWLKIRIDHISGKPDMIHALLLSKNKLYKSEKNVELRCAMSAGQWMITSYEIKGFQQLLVLDPKQFEVVGKVQF
jgi:hypothetical protein